MTGGRWGLLAVLSVIVGAVLAGSAHDGGVAVGTALNDSPGSSSMGVAPENSSPI